jgi:hypothetical protein
MASPLGHAAEKGLKIHGSKTRGRFWRHSSKKDDGKIGGAKASIILNGNPALFQKIMTEKDSDWNRRDPELNRS